MMCELALIALLNLDGKPSDYETLVEACLTLPWLQEVVLDFLEVQVVVLGGVDLCGDMRVDERMALAAAMCVVGGHLQENTATLI
eukprot:scaffold23284_cov19-Tisochrysis_lutea.AAC.6